MKFLFASDSFKGTLSSRQTAELLTKAAHEVFGDVDVASVSVADGGEGTVDAVLDSFGTDGSRKYVTVHDPLMNEIRTYYGSMSGNRAIIEMAAASGLTLVPEDKRNPFYTTSFGTGELVKAAIEDGATDITITIGGSATNDGGMGFAEALGIRFLDEEGKCLSGIGENLAKVSSIDTVGLIPDLTKVHFTVMCDVTNPLCGPKGATYTYGKQKGATDEILEVLESGMRNYAGVITKQFGIDPNEIIGGGAAGGLGAALKVFLNADVRSGIEAVLDIIDFNSYIIDADYIITGEGRADIQSTYGKVMQGVGQRGAKYGIPVLGLCGSLGDGYEKLFDYGITRMVSVSEGENIEDVMREPEKYYYKKAVELFKSLKG